MMKSHLLYFLLTSGIVLLGISLPTYTLHAETDDPHHNHDHHDDDDENTSLIDDDMASSVGIGTTIATPQTLHQTITSYGVLSTGPEQLSHMRARFAGLISSVTATTGDVVKAGDLLAEVESDQSLKNHAVRAPISGIIVQRHANKGEVTTDQVLFSIANFDTLWAEFRIYPTQHDKVTAGQTVHTLSGKQKITSTISHIIPTLDKPYQLARVQLDNKKLGLSPGLLVEGRIVIDVFSVALAVEKNSVQQLAGRSGVFVKTDNSYRFAPLVLGRSDDHYIEVIQGIEPDQRYVNKNSYLIKADIEKAAAEHEH